MKACVLNGKPLASLLLVVAGASCGGCASKGAPWTIRCLELQGPNHVQRMEQIAETLKRTPGIRPGDIRYTDDPDGFSRLYYGTYRRRTDPETGKRNIPKRAGDDLVLLKQLGVDSGKRFFVQAMLVPMPTADVGDPRWALKDAEGVYSLQVAVFEPTDDFWECKKAAAEYCAMLRKKGYEAYYHHAPASSMVTVGSFGPEAVIEQPRGLPRYSAKVMALQREELLKYNLVNYGIMRVKTESGERVPVPSRLVKIPREGRPHRW